LALQLRHRNRIRARRQVRGILENLQRYSSESEPDTEFSSSSEDVDPREDIAPIIEWRDDPENVHDTAINSSLEENFEYIFAKVDELLPIATLIEVLSSNTLPIANHVQQNAVAFLTFLQNSPKVRFIPFKCPEVEAVEVMAAYIFQSPNLDILMHNFAINCADAYNDGTPHCINGRMARLMSSFDLTEGMQPLFTINTLRNQVFSKCAMIRDDILNKADSTTVHDYNSGIENEKTDELRNEIREGMSRQIEMDFTAGKWDSIIQKILREAHEAI
jgi:hypothetical protein